MDMKFSVNPAAYSAVFTVPADVVDKHIRLAGAVQLKVLLVALKNAVGGIESEEISELLSIPLADVEDALRYWVSVGVLLVPDTVIAPEPQKKEAVPRAVIKPSREEIARRGAENEELTFLLREAQTRFGRGLKTSEASSLLWLYDDVGMSAALIIMLLEYAASEGRCNVSFIEKTAADWNKNGVTDIADAELRIAEMAKRKSAWRVVQNAFGMEKRQPSEKELEAAYLWVTEWGYGADMLKMAYDRCVDSTSKFSFAYIKKILDKWHKAGYTSPDMIADEKPKKDNNYSATDLDAIEKMLDSE